MKKTILILLAICILLPCFAVPAFAVEPPHLQSADAVLVVDMNTDTILYEVNKDQFHSIASLTKIMTCLLAVEAVEDGLVSLDDQVTAQSDVLQGLDVSSSNAQIQPGETFLFEDLIYCALVHSANDACNAIAVHVAGSIGAFVNLMNERADQLHCISTHFNDTCGMLNRTEGHFSCPYDLYLITREAMTHPLFANICGTADYHVRGTNYRPDGFDIHNSNALMSSKGLYGDGYIYDGVIGVKTGFTQPAGYCLVSICQRKEARIMAIVLGCNGPLTKTFAGEYQNFQDSAKLYEWAFSNFTNKTIFLAGEPMQRLPVEKAKDKGTVALCSTENLVLLVPKDIQEKEIVTEVIPDEGALVAPIRAGEELGTINVYVRGDKYASVRLTADADVELDKKIVRDQRIHDILTSGTLKTALISLVALLAILVGLRVFFRLHRRQQVQRKLWERERQRVGTERTPVRVSQRPYEAHPAQRRQSLQQQPPAPGRTPVFHASGQPQQRPQQPPQNTQRPQQSVARPPAGQRDPARVPPQQVRPAQQSVQQQSREPLRQQHPRAAEQPTQQAFPKVPRSGGVKIQRVQRPPSEQKPHPSGAQDISSLIGKSATSSTNSEEDLDALLAAFRREYGDK
ncbi:MAG: serine hydrolase [Oscillospiraceae bacterium]|nr:serine hydrolase [Oscillospiraceae bacterium]